MIAAPKPQPLIKPKPGRLPRAKAVTIGLATKCTDGLVMCADTQISTEEFKFYGQKLARLPVPFWPHGEIITTYSGYPETMNTVSEEFRKLLLANTQPEHAFRETLNSIFTGQEEEDHQILCAFSDGGDIRLLKSSRNRVSPVPVWDCVGRGDSSLTRYLAAIFLGTFEHLPVALGVPVCDYIITQAKKYVRGCGGDTNLFVLTKKGKVHEQVLGSQIDATCEQIERRLNEMLTLTTMLNVDEDQCLELIRRLRELIRNSAEVFGSFTPAIHL